MRYLAIAMLTLSLNALNAGQGVSKPEESKKMPAKEQAPERKMVLPDEVDQHDDTDIFAIPFDTSEAEEEIEIEQLDALSKKIQADKAKQMKQQPKPKMPE